VALEHRVAAIENYEITKSNDSNDKIVGYKETSGIVTASSFTPTDSSTSI